MARCANHACNVVVIKLPTIPPMPAADKSGTISMSPSVISRVYDEQIGIFTPDGVFDPQAVAVLKKSFIEMGLLKEPPADDVMFTTQFLPIK